MAYTVPCDICGKLYWQINLDEMNQVASICRDCRELPFKTKCEYCGAETDKLYFCAKCFNIYLTVRKRMYELDQDEIDDSYN